MNKEEFLAKDVEYLGIYIDVEDKKQVETALAVCIAELREKLSESKRPSKLIHPDLRPVFVHKPEEGHKREDGYEIIADFFQGLFDNYWDLHPPLLAFVRELNERKKQIRTSKYSYLFEDAAYLMARNNTDYIKDYREFLYGVDMELLDTHSLEMVGRIENICHCFEISDETLHLGAARHTTLKGKPNRGYEFSYAEPLENEDLDRYFKYMLIELNKFYRGSERDRAGIFIFPGFRGNCHFGIDQQLADRLLEIIKACSIRDRLRYDIKDSKKEMKAKVAKNMELIPGFDELLEDDFTMPEFEVIE